MENEYMALPAIRNIMERKSVRSYDSRTVEEAKIDAILRAGSTVGKKRAALGTCGSVRPGTA